jgi:hypothetical protein
MNSKSTNANDMLVKRTKRYCLLLLGFLLLFGWFGIRLATTESAEDWKEADITIADVQHVSRKHNSWKITDTDGNTYSTHESQDVMAKILPNSTYHIYYTTNDNDIRAMTQGNSVVVDYAHSVSVHCERNIWDWVLTFLGLAGAIATITYMVIDIRKKIIQG